MTVLPAAAGWSLCSPCDSSCCVCTERLLCASSVQWRREGHSRERGHPRPWKVWSLLGETNPLIQGRAGERSCQGGGGGNPAEVTWKGVRRDAAGLRPVAGRVGQGDAAPRALGRERGECPQAQSIRAVGRKLGLCRNAQGQLAGVEEQAAGQGWVLQKKQRKADDAGSRWAPWRNLGGQGWGQ